MITAYRKHVDRRGVAILIVLGILAMTMGVCYAMLRSQSTASMIEGNQQRLGDARSAAMTGMSIALAKIHTAQWGGVNSTLSGSLGTGLSYSVQYVAGDPSLTTSSPDYGDLPYRVTVTSTGTAVHPTISTVTSTHKIQTVVQLVPRAMAATPAKWASIQNHTVFQWGSDAVTFELPARIEGSVHAQGAFALAPSYPTQDQRPFAGRIDEVAIYNKALTETDIWNIHVASITPFQNPESTISSLGPIAYWRFNESAGAVTAADATGSNAAVYVGAKSGDAMKPFSSAGSSALFDGDNDHVRCGRFDITTSAMTILCWFRADSFPAVDQHLVSKATSLADSDQTWLLGTTIRSGQRRLMFGARTSHSWKLLDANSGTLSTGVWTFAAGVYDGNKLIIYKDGVDESNVGHSGTISANGNAFILIGDTPPGSPRTKLLRDYRAMQLAGQTDMRPLTGTWNAPTGQIQGETTRFMQDDLGTSSQTVSADTTAPLTIPGDVGTYQIYTGGPLYSIPDPGSSLENISLAANPNTNPLGLYKHSGSVDVNNSVTGNGTLLLYGSGNLTLKGTGTTWSAVVLPKVDGESMPRRLPAFIVYDTFKVDEEAIAAQVDGAVIAGLKFETEDRTDASPGVTVSGRVVTKALTFGKRKNTTTSASDWRSYVQSFLLQSTQPYFPPWLNSNQSMNLAPLCTIRPDPAGNVDHWPDFTQPIFTIRTGDGGLRWRIVSWRDGI